MKKENFKGVLIGMLIAIGTVVVQQCAIFRPTVDVFCKDWKNPCTNMQDCEECETWRAENPKEYRKYLQRMKDYKYIEICPEQQVRIPEIKNPLPGQGRGVWHGFGYNSESTIFTSEINKQCRDATCLWEFGDTDNKGKGEIRDGIKWWRELMVFKRE